MRNALADYYRCPAALAPLEPVGKLSGVEGYFRVGDATCYGRLSHQTPAQHATDNLDDVAGAISWNGGGLRLPYDLASVVQNLQLERYRPKSSRTVDRLRHVPAADSAYYLLRPYLPLNIRKHIQRLCLYGWETISFPRWPVDCTVDTLMRESMISLLCHKECPEIPFVWFWPEGAQACLVMTHDVDTREGADFCGELMALDDAYGFKSAFHIIPEGRYEVTSAFLSDLRDRGCETNVHDINHDGRLFHSYDVFTNRVQRINEYGRKFDSRGFRAGAMYRRQDWFDMLDFSYDMSIPNVAHLEPQGGGCCSVMPFFVGRILELPLTTIQDYSLFHVLDDYSIHRWAEQIELILSRSGLVTFVTHPDYLIDKRARGVYRQLLEHLAVLRKARNVWMALPGEVDTWWRSRQKMSVVKHGAAWQVEGPESHRARVAYAAVEGGRLTYRFDNVQ